MKDGRTPVAAADAVDRIGLELHRLSADLKAVEGVIFPAVVAGSSALSGDAGLHELQWLDRILQSVDALATMLCAIAGALEAGEDDVAAHLATPRLAELTRRLMQHDPADDAPHAIELFG